jgi:medium-chain acyl-[acyl-carrier-protein] hydrolase
MKISMSSHSWFPQSTRTDSNLRLFCFPYAGGSAVIYRQWSSMVDRRIEIVAAHLPGRASRIHEPAYRNLDSLVAAMAEAIAPQLNQPFAFFGHSMGSVVAFEMARTLRAQGMPSPSTLLVSARRAPHVPPRRAPIYNLSDSQFIAELRALKGTPETVLNEPDLLRLMMPTLRADFAAIETYHYREAPPLDIPISVFGGLEDQIPPEDLDAWRVHTRSRFTVRMFPGDHFFLHSSGPALAGAVSEEVLRLQTDLPRVS